VALRMNRSALAANSIDVSGHKFAENFFLNCTKNTELTNAAFARRV
jgi:hypothetical protein